MDNDTTTSEGFTTHDAFHVIGLVAGIYVGAHMIATGTNVARRKLSEFKANRALKNTTPEITG